MTIRFDIHHRSLVSLARDPSASYNFSTLPLDLSTETLLDFNDYTQTALNIHHDHVFRHFSALKSLFLDQELISYRTHLVLLVLVVLLVGGDRFKKLRFQIGSG